MQDAVLQDAAVAPLAQDRAAGDVLARIAEAARAYIDAAEELDESYRRRLNRWPEHAARTAGRLRLGAWAARHEDIADLELVRVRVTRAPGDSRVEVPIGVLSGFCMTAYTGGKHRRLGRPMLAARMSCDDLPAVPWHSCKHGPPPHRILVVIPRAHNDGDVFRRLRVVAERGSRGWQAA